MSPDKKRWILLAIILLALPTQGVAYAASVFMEPLREALGRTAEQWRGDWAWTFGLPFALVPLGMLLSGPLSDRGRVKISLALGALGIGGGWFLGGFADRIAFMEPLHWVWLTYGLMLSLGGGCSYGAAVGAALRWFPDRRGLASGLVVGSLGFGTFLGAFLLEAGLGWWGVLDMFKIYGLLFALLLGVCAVVIANPPPGYAPEGYTPPAPAPGVAVEGLEWPAMLRRGRFWVMFLAYFCATFPGLLMMAVAKPAAVSLGGLSAAAAVTAVSFIGLANSGGRVLWGTLSDMAGRAKTLVIVTLVLVCAMTILALGGGGWTLWAGYVFSAMCFGGALGLFPSLTTEAFGVKRATTNYAFMFCAFGFASLVAPWVGGRFHTPGGDIRFAAAFSFAAGVAAVGFLLAAGLGRAGRKGAEHAD